MSIPDLALRWFWIAVGLLFAIWIGIEDRDLTLVTIEAALIAAGLGATGAGRVLSGLRPSGWYRTVWLAGVGALAGVGWGPIAVVLIALKTSLHTHPVPDFTEADVMAMLSRIPLWTLIGTLMGLGVGVLTGRAE